MFDGNIALAGSGFPDLPETYIIFINERDVLGEGKPLYHINRIVEETGKLFNDEAHIIYVNSEIKDDINLGRVMYDFFCENPEDIKCDVLAKIAYVYKRTEKGMKMMSDYIESQVAERMAGREEELIRRGKDEGKAEGKAEGKEEAAFELLEHSPMSKADIASILHIPMDRIKKLAQRCSNKS